MMAKENMRLESWATVVFLKKPSQYIFPASRPFQQFYSISYYYLDDTCIDPQIPSFLPLFTRPSLSLSQFAQVRILFHLSLKQE